MKHNNGIRPFRYGKKEVGLAPKRARKPSINFYFHKRKYANSFRDYIVDSYKLVYSHIRTRKNRISFLPGQKVFVIVSAPNGNRKIVADYIDYVHCFGFLQKGYSIYYYLKNTDHSGGGINADSIFASYNEAKFFLYY